jgi:hypothetical protein
MRIVTADITGSLIVNNVNVTSTVESSSIWSGSIAQRVTNLESWSSSLDATYATDAQVSASILVLSQSVQASQASLSSSFATTSGSLSTRVTSLESASSSFASDSASLSTRLTTDETNITTLTNASSSFAAQSASLSTRLTTDETNYTTTSGSNSTRLNALETAGFTTTGSNTFVGTQYISQASNANSFTSTASLYTDGGLRVAKDSYVSGTAYFNNVTIYGTQSVSYITSSQLNITDNIISVNTFTPAIRFGGLAVYDSGSTGLSGSMLWDSEQNRWIYSNPSGSSYDGGMIISGPRNTTGLGNEQGTLSNYVTKGQGGDHITSSAIYETASLVGIGVTPSPWDSTWKTIELYNQGNFIGSESGKATFIGSNNIYSGSNYKYVNTNGAAQYILQADGSHKWRVATSGTAGSAITWIDAMFLSSSGNFGINTLTPTYPLDVLTSVSSSANIQAQFYNSDYGSGVRNFIRVRNGISAGSTYSSYFGQGQDGKTYIISNDLTRKDFVIDGNNGVVSMGTASSTVHSNSSGLIVAGTGGNRGIIEVWDSSATAGKAVFQNVGGVTYVGSLSSGSGAGTFNLLVGGNGSSATVGMSLSGSGYAASFGRTDFAYPLNITSPYAKTDTTGRGLLFMGSNEAISSNPFGLVTVVTGASTLANRSVIIGTTDYGLANGGNLCFQTSAGNVGIGTTSPSDILDVQKNQNAITNFYLRNTDTTNTNSRAFLNIVSGNTTLLLGTIHNDNAYIKPNTATALYLGYNNALKITSGNNLEYVGSTPNANYNIATDGVKVTVASGGTIDFQYFSGLIVINNHSNGNCAMWLVGAGLVSLIGQSASGAATGTMSYNGGITGYTWTSTYGSTAYYGVFAVRTRSNA